MAENDKFHSRLTGGPADEYIDNLRGPEFELLKEYFFEPLFALNRAHVIMLQENDLLEAETAAEIMRVFDQIEAEGIDESLSGADYSDIHFYVEEYLIDEIGEKKGGVLQTGRSRTDVYDAAGRIVVREKLLAIIDNLTTLRSAVLDLAAESTETVMTGYTHSQPAQPITLSHYLLSFDNVLGRDFDRLKRAYDLTNDCPLGSAVMGGTGFDIDRDRLAELSGYDGLCFNTYDATASMDFIPEATSAAALLMTNISRVVRDLIEWGTHEFDVAEISDGYASVSSMMPQKKNPYTLEKLRTEASDTIGAANSSLVHLKAAPYGDVSEVAKYAFVPLVEESDEIERMLRLLAGVIDTIEIKEDQLYQSAAENFCTMTEVADTLVREDDLSFRQAHEIVGTMVRIAIDDGRTADELTIDDLNQAARTGIDREATVGAEEFQQAIDPAVNVERRDIPGGTAPARNEEELERRRKHLADHKSWVEETYDVLHEAEAKRRAGADKLIEAHLESEPAGAD